MKRKHRRYWSWVAVGIGALALFLFFFGVLPHHLFHKEQTQLFLWAAEPMGAYWTKAGALAAWTGDFLTQFFYYEGVGPAVVTAMLLVWGGAVYRLFRPYAGGWAGVPALLAVLWEGGRLCVPDYPLSGTVALTGIAGVLLLCRWYIGRWRKAGVAAAVACVAAGYYLFGTGNWSKGYGVPNLQTEQLLAVDTEMYFGRTDKVRHLLKETELRTPMMSYYHNLLNAREGALPDRLPDYYQPLAHGLFLPVAPTEDYLHIFAANEVWFALGDMTMAEHAAILGMIFSPQHTGTRALRRLAEINLINGDEAAAMKYLRLLRQTCCHRDWAERRMPGRQTDEVKRWLERKRTQLATTDTVRLAGEVPTSLRNLLKGNPQHTMARDYLLCFDLLNKDIEAFAADYKAYGTEVVSSRLYAEALLIYLAGSGATPQEAARWKMAPQVLQDFADYTRLYEANGGNGASLQAKYGKSYWFYFHYAKKTTEL